MAVNRAAHDPTDPLLGRMTTWDKGPQFHKSLKRETKIELGAREKEKNEILGGETEKIEIWFFSRQLDEPSLLPPPLPGTSLGLWVPWVP